MPVHANDRLDGGALEAAGTADCDQGLVRHEQDRVAVVLQARMNAGKVGLSQLDQLVLVLTDDGFAARTRYVCLHVAAFPSTDEPYF